MKRNIWRPRAYERLGEQILKVATFALPASALGLLIWLGIFQKKISLEYFWFGLLVVIILWVQGVFLYYTGQDVKNLSESLRGPASTSASTVFYQCAYLAVKEVDYSEGIKNIVVRCNAGQIKESGCPLPCYWFRHFSPIMPPPGPGALAGMVIGGVAGALGGPLGALAGATLGTLIGAGLETERSKSPLQREIEDAQRRKISYRIVIQI